MKVLVLAVRGESKMKAITVGNDEARDSRRMVPEADQTNTSIWPGVSTRMCLTGGFAGCSGSGVVRFSRSLRIWSTLVEKRFSDVRMPPFGPRLYCNKTTKKKTQTQKTKLLSKGTFKTAGSKLMT